MFYLCTKQKSKRPKQNLYKTYFFVFLMKRFFFFRFQLWSQEIIKFDDFLKFCFVFWHPSKCFVSKLRSRSFLFRRSQSNVRLLCSADRSLLLFVYRNSLSSALRVVGGTSSTRQQHAQLNRSNILVIFKKKKTLKTK